MSIYKGTIDQRIKLHGRTTIELINQFEQTDMTVGDFNSIFVGSKINAEDSIYVEIGEITKRDNRNLSLSDGTTVVNAMLRFQPSQFIKNRDYSMSKTELSLDLNTLNNNIRYDDEF